ncbi:hypothetical protein DM02DRAFT_640041 [Periconia macrospinosa]|uniref:Nuclear pore complex component n=1 Tax=Periconia macrospinosa TaxID=97972 RepID=A0A2V1E195_9PLEO|nr:hypothetical protein DM02DRAFT_640041 [Periconia macrospinosa]
MPATPTTPQAQTYQTSTPSGTWKHPRFDEITRRQNATNFDESNVWKIVSNGGLLILSFVARGILASIALPGFESKPALALLPAVPYRGWIVNSFRVILLLNILIALYPLVLTYYPDDLADIPLTPSQRLSMGLDPNVTTPQTPGSAYQSPNYITPPRYQKSTPRSSFSNQGSQSPLSGSPRASMANSTSDSPFSSNNAGSPLFQKAVGGGSSSTRLSFGGTPMGNSFFSDSSSSATPGTPTPGGGRASVGLNNKWLYEKRRDSPRSNLFN